jgi:HEAT repeat protein
MIALAVLLIVSLTFTDDELTKDDIPPNLSPELRTLIQQTFSNDPIRRGKVADELGDMGAKASAAVPFLIHLLGDKSYTTSFEIDVSICASVALENIGSASIEPLITAVKQARGEKKRSIIYAMSHFDDPRIVAALAALLSDPEDRVRERAAQGLRDCLNRKPEYSEVPIVMPSLINALKDPIADNRGLAAYALGNSRDPRAFEPLLQSLNDKDLNARISAISALGYLGDRRAEPVLLEILHNRGKGEFDRDAAAFALGRLGGEKAIEALIRVLADSRESERLRMTVAVGLKHAKAQQAVMQLMVVAKDRSEPVNLRMSAIEAVAAIESTKAISFLTRFATAKDEPRGILWSAAYPLVDLTDGAIDDTWIVMAINSFPGGSDFLYYDGNGALEKIVTNGLNRSVREAARKALTKRGIPHTSEYKHLIFLALSTAYYLASLALWAFINRKAIKKFTVRSLLALATLWAFGIPLVVLTWKAW